MHFDLTVSLGNLVVFLAVGGFAWRIERLFNLYGIEHEMLISDYCQRLGIKMRDLPTRTKGLGKA